MTTIPGGAADKLGNRYELWWTVAELVSMLHGKSESIRIEDPGVRKAEFVVVNAGRRTLHQAKMSHPSGKWTLANLGGSNSKILQAVFEQLVGNDARFLFVSASHAEELDTLAERACQSASLAEFQKLFISDQKYRKAFASLQGFWGDVGSATAYTVLRRIEVRTISEKDIREKVDLALPSLFLASPVVVAAALLRIAQDAVHKTITREVLIDQLAAEGYVLRGLRHVGDAAALVETVTREYLKSVRSKLIRRTLIARSATQELLDRARRMEDGSETVLTGKAGAGKTGCVIGLVDAAKEQGMTVMAFRLDRITPVRSATELGRELGLEESPALVLEAASAGRPALLVIDQLDAVSVVSGRGSAFLDAVHGLLAEARSLRERMCLHVVVVCRHFDWEHDPSLRRIVADSHAKVEVTELSSAEATNILGVAGFQAKLFTSGQIELLRLPQNLSLFLISGFDPESTPEFNSAKELFDRYWTEKRARVSERASPIPDQWSEVIQLLCDEMTRTQQLSVAREVLDSREQYALCMASEGVLTSDGKRFGFGHESFFDYCFARAFVRGRETLVEFLIASEQHLFRRAQVRQVLAYLRDADGARYCCELGGLLSDRRVRAHIKELSMALVAAVPDPGEDEWQLLEPLVKSELAAFERGAKNANRLASLVWLHLFRSHSWFAFFDGRGWVAGWLASEAERIADMGVQYLRAHERRLPDRIVELLEPYVGVAGRWAERLRFVIQWADHGKSRRLFELLLRLVDDGTLDEARGPIAVNSTFWSMFHGMGETQPAWVGELLAHWMRRRRVLIGSARDKNGKISWRELFNHDDFALDKLHQGAEGAPRDYVAHVVPVVLDLSAEAVYEENTELPRRDRIWPFLMKTEHESVGAAVITSLAFALRKCAEDPDADLTDVIHRLRAHNTFIANFLLLVLYTFRPDRFADEAARLLCAETWRFNSGYIDSPYWISMELIRAIVPRCSSEVRCRLEMSILAYTPELEQSAEGHKLSGRACFSLLSCFERDHLSSSGLTRLGELKRKFGEPETEPRGILTFLVESPIKKEGADRMSDSQWLRAIAKYDTNDMLYRLKSPDKGGALELASLLGEFTKAEPERFAQLCLLMPSTTNAVYFSRVLDGLKDAEMGDTLKLDVCKKVFSEWREQCGRSLADLLGTLEDRLPDDAVSMLTWLATEHADPTQALNEQSDADGDRPEWVDLHTRGINSTRGRAAEAICELIWRDPHSMQLFRGTIERLVDDESGAVRSCAASILHAVSIHEWAWALELFSRLIAADEAILHAPGVYRFLHLGVHRKCVDVRPFVERMLRASTERVAEPGARLAALSVLYGNAADDMVNECLNGRPAQRLGIAQVAARNIGTDECREWCEVQLLRLFEDDDAAVRREAASCFRQLIKSPLKSYEQLITAFCNSAAYTEDTFWIFHLLEEAVHGLPEVTCDVCERFLDRFADEARDLRTRRAGDSHTVAALVFRTYQQHQSDSWASRCLDLIDRMCIEGMSVVQEGLTQFDR